MHLRQLISRCRTMSADNGKPPFWTDQLWTDALNDAVSEACVRADLLPDDRVTAAVTAGNPYVAVPSRCYSIRGVSINGKTMKLTTRSQIEVGLGNSWQDDAGTPSACYRIRNELRLYPIPDTSATAEIVAHTTPKDSDVMLLQYADEVSPVIQERLHGYLVDWALHLFFSVPDADFFNAAQADRHEARFAATFGPRRTEQEMQRVVLKSTRETRVVFF